MHALIPLQPVDYVVVGHLAVDMTPAGLRLGGTAAYSALTARALGWRVGIVTACDAEAPLDALRGIQIVSASSPYSTTFENISTLDGRKQILHHRAAELSFDQIPSAWRDASILHAAPIAQEISSDFSANIPANWIGLTPQGWMRAWDEDGRVQPCAWKEAGDVLPRVRAAVISREDVAGDEEQIEFFAHRARVLAVTEGAAGARLFWNGDQRRFRTPQVREVDATGAGDIFAAAFFIRLRSTRDPWEAARFATQLAAFSVTRPGLEGIPTQEEIRTCSVEVLS